MFVRHTLGKDKSELFKVHVVLYTCASSRAVHLDIVPDISSEAFVRSLKRFVSRRGIPKLFISDNAKCFIGKELKCYLNLIHTDWQYILERSPWWGGFWERLVQTVKRSLRKVLKKSKVTYEELLTIVIEIEGIINSRPLCYQYSSCTDDVLTPSHLMLGRRLLSREDKSVFTELISTPENINRQVNYLNSLIDHFEGRWKHEYLTEFREFQRCNNQIPANQVKVGDVVLIEDKNLPRSRWRLGLVTNLIESKDKFIRGCRLRVCKKNGKTSYLNRPVNKLCYFEVHSRGSGDAKHNEQSSNQVNDTIENVVDEVKIRPRRLAAVTGELKRTLSKQV